LTDQNGIHYTYSLPFGKESLSLDQSAVKTYYFFALYGPNVTEVGRKTKQKQFLKENTLIPYLQVPLGGYSEFQSGQNYLGVVVGNVTSENPDFTPRLAIVGETNSQSNTLQYQCFLTKIQHSDAFSTSVWFRFRFWFRTKATQLHVVDRDSLYRYNSISSVRSVHQLLQPILLSIRYPFVHITLYDYFLTNKKLSRH